MKKIIAAAVVASMVVPCFSVSAAGKSEKEVSSVYGDKSEIHIVYNDKVVKDDDVKPVNTDGQRSRYRSERHLKIWAQALIMMIRADL